MAQLQTTAVTGSLTVTGNITAQSLVVQTITSSISYITGSTIFGSSLSNTHQITGSFYQTGSLAVFAGNVGIGTTAPDTSLVINANDPIIRLRDSSTSNVMFVGVDDSGGYVRNFTNESFRIINAGGSIQVIVNSSGNVGIGTTAPGVKLHVVGASIISNTTSINADSYGSTVIAGGITQNGGGWALTSAIGGNGAVGHSWAIGTNGDNLYMGYQNQSAAGTMQTFLQVAGRNLFLVPVSGNVGIGTTSPNYKLKVEGDLGVTSTARFTGVAFSDSRLMVGTNYADQTYANVFIAGALSSGASQYALLLDPQLGGTNNYGLLANARIKASTAATNAYGIYIVNSELLSGASITNNYGLYIANQTNGSSLNYAIYSAGGTVYFGGSVGIGTTAPSSILQLGAGSYTATNTSYNSFHAGGFSVLFRDAYDAYLAFNTVYTAGGWVNKYNSSKSGIINMNDGALSIDTGAGTTAGGNSVLTTRFVMLNNGCVGIGTTSPSYLLHVVGDVGAGGIFNARYTANETYKGTFGWNHLQLGNNAQNDLVAGRTATGGYFRFIVNNTTNYTYNTYDGSIAMVILANGNVGIGSTAPAYPLDLGIGGTGNSIRARRIYANGTGTDSGFSLDNTLIYQDSGGKFNITNPGSYPNIAFTIDTSGNVGIGTTAPAGKLDIQTNSSGDILHRFWNTNTAGTGASAIRIANSGNNNNGSRIEFTDTSYYVATIAGDRTQGLTFRTDATGASATGTSIRMIILPGGNIGIGTSSPNTLLAISKTISADTRFLEINNLGNNQYSSNIDFTVTSGGITVGRISSIYPASNNVGLTFSTYGTSPSTGLHERLRINGSDGNVGIGTTAPSAKLQVSGSSDVLNVKGSGSLSNTSLLSVDGAYGRLFEVTDDLSNSLFSVNTIAGLPVIEAFADYSVNLGTYSAVSGSTMRITGSSVGIGTTAPATKLHVRIGSSGATPYNDGITVENSGRVALNLLSSTGNDSYIFFGNSSSGNAGYVGYENTANRLVVRSTGYISLVDGSSEAIRITGGNVGIGTTSPSNPLHIARTAAVSPSIRLQTTDSTTNGSIAWANSTNTILAIIGSNANISDGSGNLEFMTGGTTTRMVINSSGNVGIGTTAPSAKLVVNGTTWINQTADYGGAASKVQISAGSASDNVVIRTNSLYLYNYGNIHEALIRYGNGQETWNIGTTSGVTPDFRLYEANGASERLTIKAGGNVGIGTTAPAFKLHTYGSNPRNYIQDSGTGYPILQLVNSSGDFYIAIDNSAGSGFGSAYGRYIYSAGAYPLIMATNGTERMRISPGGSLLLGDTINPSEGAWFGTAALGKNGTNKVIAGYLGSSTNGAVIGGHNSALTAWADLNIAGTNLIFRSGETEYMRLASTGNVGIGSTSPTYKLDVNGSIKAGSGTGNEQGLYIKVGNTSSDYSVIRFYHDVTNISTIHSFPAAWQSGTIYSTSANSINVQGAGGTTFGVWTSIDVAFITGGTNYFKGSVGIGTTTPARKLEVYTTSTTETAAIKINNSSYTAKGYLGIFSENFYISSGGTYSSGWTADGTNTIPAIVLESANSNSSISLQTTTTNGTGPATRLIVQGNGNVGIGTTSPASTLHVYGASNPHIKVQAGGGSYSYIQLDDASSNGYLIKNITSNSANNALPGALYTYTDNNNAFQHIHAGTPLFTILSGGNVGIGTTSPTRTLDVRGSANIQSSGSLLLLVTGSQGELLKVQDSGSSLGTLAVISSTTTNVATFTTSSVIISGSLLVNGSTHGIAEHMILAVSDETTNITTGTAKVTFRAPFAMTLTQIPRASLSTASTSGLVTVDINEAGTSILGANKLSIDANELTSTTAATPTTLADTSIADDAQITIDIDGAGTGARGLKVTLYYVKV